MSIWRRHAPPCESTDRSDPKCGCPIYKEYRAGKKRHRLTLKTRNWQKALAVARKEELEGVKPKSPSIQEATQKYLTDAKARNLAEPTLDKFRLLFRRLEEFAQDKGYVFVSDLDIDALRNFRAKWPNKNESARVKLGNLKSFFRFCHESGWIQTNPAAKLKHGKVQDPVIEPLTSEEFGRIVQQAEKARKNATRLKALVLLMRFTGLRIRDAVTLKKSAVENGKLFLRMAKTGLGVYCPLPPEAIKALAAIKSDTPYYFWSGHSKPKSAVGDYQRALKTIFERAKVPRAYPHLFRHTFATQLLQDGVSLETVAMLLGHSTTKITAKHYSHWVRARQDRLEEEVKKSWAQLGTVATGAA